MKHSHFTDEVPFYCSKKMNQLTKYFKGFGLTVAGD